MRKKRLERKEESNERMEPIRANLIRLQRRWGGRSGEGFVKVETEGRDESRRDARMYMKTD